MFLKNPVWFDGGEMYIPENKGLGAFPSLHPPSPGKDYKVHAEGREMPSACFVQGPKTLRFKVSDSNPVAAASSDVKSVPSGGFAR